MKAWHLLTLRVQKKKEKKKRESRASLLFRDSLRVGEF